MALRSAPLLLLVLVAVALREGYFGTSSHSLMFFSTVISEPSQGLPQFVSVGSVDGQVFAYYDSNTRRVQPRVSWMEKVGKEDPQYWDRNTQRVRYSEVAFRDILETVRRLYNQSEGLHTWQRMDGCELWGNKSKGGVEQHGYDGRSFLTFDKETLTWVAPDPQARITQRKWDALPGYNQRTKFFLEEFCIEWLEKYLSYGKETLLRTGGSLPALHLMAHLPRPSLEGSTSTIEMTLAPRGDHEQQDGGGGWDGDARLLPVWLLPQGDRCLLDEGRGGLAAGHPPWLRGPQRGWDLPRHSQHPDRSEREGPLSLPRGARRPAGASGPGPEGAKIQPGAHHRLCCGWPCPDDVCDCWDLGIS